ncbi:uncharacterized protein MKK02DRAFT_26943 [Dioszegia hungarica]|uniref:glutathione transferase n=1 Tax=Dioszegia hungarica TaxID=4972 RepID=A0AA38H8W6_9TREE|nr:uncharacterized protein MKK02DRAFT_26943 [Dioszegia hungarica]KAI9636082.1 hypothetical protein MKK02DRAFT_26943 [Dioszegia hungarica]
MGLELQKGESSIELNQTDLQADEQDFKIDQADFSQLKSPAWLEHQPFGQLPYLVDTETGVEIFETRAMIRYVASRVKSPLQPTADGDLAAYARYEQAAQNEVTQFMGPTDAMAHEIGSIHADIATNELIRKQKAVLAKKLEGYERILSKHNYLDGDVLTLADLAHLPYGAIAAKVNGSLPNVARWWKELESHPAWLNTKDLGHSS